MEGHHDPEAREYIRLYNQAHPQGQIRYLGPCDTGGMGKVWLVERCGQTDTYLRRALRRLLRKAPEQMVLKANRTDLHYTHGQAEANSAGLTAVYRRCFEAELAAMQELDDPHIMPLAGCRVIRNYADTGADLYLLLMPRLEPLMDYLKEHPLDEQELLVLARHLAGALACSHRRQILHRDLKLSNIFVRRLPDGTAQYILGDFGAARDNRVNRTPWMTGITGDGYRPPEAARPDCYDYDVYMLGGLLYTLVTGDHADQCAIDPGKLEQLSPGFRRVICKCMAQDAQDRYADGAQVLWALNALDRPLRHSGTVITENLNYRQALAALAAGDLEAARRCIRSAQRAGEPGSDILGLFYDICLWKQSPEPAQAQALLERARLLRERGYRAVGFLAAKLAADTGDRQQYLRLIRRSAEVDRFPPAQYFHGRALLHRNTGTDRADGLRFIIDAAQAGYWPALRELHDRQPLSQLPSSLAAKLQTMQEEFDDPILLRRRMPEQNQATPLRELLKFLSMT